MMWGVRRMHAELAGLPSDPRLAPHPDRTIVVPAMAEYIRFAGRQIGMPTIASHGGRETLRDGTRLLEALRLAGRGDEIYCLWLGEPNSGAPAGGERFSPMWEERTGSGAR